MESFDFETFARQILRLQFAAGLRNGRLWVVSYPRLANSRTVAAFSEEEDTALALEL